jgi:hypothetical protein
VVAFVNYTATALLIGSVLIMVAGALVVNAPTYVPIARVDLSLVEVSLKQATLNALVGYVNRKYADVNTALSRNTDPSVLDRRFVPLNLTKPYIILFFNPVSTMGYWSEASLSVKYTLSVGGRSVNYTCTVKLSSFVISTSTEGIYTVVTARFYDENGIITNPNLVFNPKPVKVEVSGNALELYYLQRPSVIEVVDERNLKVYLTL